MATDRWETYYTGHPAWRRLVELADALQKVRPEVEDDFDHIKRLHWVFGYLTEMRDNPSPLVSTTALSQLDAALANVINSLVAWTPGQSQHLTNAAVSYLDAVLEALRGWPTAKDRYAKGTLAAAREVQGAAEATLDRLREEVEQLTATVATSKEASEHLSTETADHIAALRQQIDAAEAQVAAQSRRLDDALNGLQATFAAAEAERASAHQAAVREQLDSAADAAETARNGAREVLELQRTEGDAHLAALNTLENDAKKLVNAIGVTGTATEYGSYAKQERTAANWLRGCAVAAFAGALGLVVVTLWRSPVDEATPWQAVALRLGGSVALIAAGAYLAKESTHHREEERLAKNKQLDLVALDPFIVHLNRDEQLAIKAAAARRLFTSPDSRTSNQDTGADTLAQTIAAAVETAVRGALRRD